MSIEHALDLCKACGMDVPDAPWEKSVQPRRRVYGKAPTGEAQVLQSPFVAASAFAGTRDGYVFKLGGNGLGYYSDSRSV